MNKKNLNMPTNKEAILLMIIIVFSFFIYWKDIDRIPYGIENDEISWTAISLFDQYGIIPTEKGVWSLTNTVAQTFPVSIKINQLSFIVFGKDFLSPKKMLVIVHLISLFFFYLVSKQFMSKKSALTITLLYSLSTYNLISHKIVLSPIFSQLFLFPAIFFILILSSKNTLRNFVFAFLAGAAISLGLLTHNLSYTLPFIGIALLCFFAYKHLSPLGIWFALKNLFILLIFFLIPIILSSWIWLPGIREEATSKTYALGNMAFEIKQNKLYFSRDRLINNVHIVNNQLFDSLKYETSDMVVRYSGSLVNKIISIAFLFGLVVSILKIKKYLSLLIWLFLGGFIYHVSMGLFLPRMWALTVGLLYLFTGITIDVIFQYLSRFRISRILGSILILALSAYIISSDLRLYYHSAVNNSSFFSSRREILEIAKQHKKSLGDKVLFIGSEELSSLTNLDNVYTAVSFTYLATNPQKSEILKQMSRKQLGVLTKDEFIQAIDRYLINEKTITVVDNTILADIEKQLNQRKQCNYDTNKHNYFAEIMVSCISKS